MTLDLGILLALACAFVANLGFFYKHRGANSVPKIDVRHPLKAARSLYSSKWFTIGMITATTATNIGTIIMRIVITVNGATSNQRLQVARHVASYLRFRPAPGIRQAILRRMSASVICDHYN